jgi:pyruvate dehydrogenase E2 component (dihydrolipoamide acetyltransferase)
MLTRGLKFITPLACRFKVFRTFATLPDHETLKMPALSPTMSEGTIVKWNKKEGDKVKTGEIMFEVETDKATVGYEVQDDVFIAKILAKEGAAKIPLGYPVAILVSKADRVAAFKDYVPASETTASAPSTPSAPSPLEKTPETVSAPASLPVSTPPSHDKARVFISPIAKNLAKENSIDYKTLSGSGPNGRIVKNDVLSALSKKISEPPAKQPEPVPVVEDRPGYKDVPNSSIRKITAARLTESKQTIPHFYVSIDCRMTKLLDLRKSLNEISETKVSVNDLVVKASALASLKVPQANSSWSTEAIRTYDNVDISIAVQTPRGLITPIIKNAHIKRIGEIAKEAKELAGLAKEGKLKPEQFIGGTFTISNLGMFGVKEFTAIINPPQVCILAVGASEDRVVPSADGFKVESFMTVTLSSDHRVVDGAIGANWLKAFKSYIEEPYTMLL